jgi:hypothetical protein
MMMMMMMMMMTVTGIEIKESIYNIFLAVLPTEC